MIYLVLLSAIFISGCSANEGILRSGKETPSPANNAGNETPIADDIEAMHTAQFTFIYVLRRKDGGLIDAGDRSVLRVQTDGANRRISADGGHAFIIGSNFQLPANNMAALYDRFTIEDYSPAPAPNANVNANANK